MSTPNPDVEMISQHLEQMGEHFDSVQIFATRHDAGGASGTLTFQLGTGNWYARYGQISEWVTKQKELARIHAREGT